MEKEKRMLQTCHWEMKERILHVVWSNRVTNADARQRTDVKGIMAVAHSLKWKWGGHVARMDQHR
jgi:hypothetical protein